MNQRIVADLRSDTVTRPTAAMRAAMAAAEVGDDVLGDDPTVLALQERAAALLGKEAAIFTPSGTMANQIAIRLHTQHGDEVICHRDSHAFYYESGAPAALSGVSSRFLEGARGQFSGSDVQAVLRPVNSHFSPSRLVIVENTHNRGGGSIWSMDKLADVSRTARAADLKIHLDGARLLNACIAAGHQPKDYTQYVDTVSMCFSKGLGAPVGSVLAGSREAMKAAHRYRKMFGGGMRQAGILAAAALYALDHHVERLAEDHAHARRLALGLAEIPGLRINPDEVETNILFMDVEERLGSAADLCERLRQSGVLMLTEKAQRLRAVTHLDVTGAQIDEALNVIRRVIAGK
ncbi:MAG: L-allo-threonine aldolase [Phycisphaerae bacterium]|nr:L-allo-threonine aldolase [Phycisphaerae bacterium]